MTYYYLADLTKFASIIALNNFWAHFDIATSTSFTNLHYYIINAPTAIKATRAIYEVPVSANAISANQTAIIGGKVYKIGYSVRSVSDGIVTEQFIQTTTYLTNPTSWYYVLIKST